ncbi:F-box/SPRY domain-containing protein 1-like [Melanaphis sacchari]|uniref:F-box/SPRY domain-containing protein 1-like n=1 Tax=Melanaphis sacchari TaxID=742174 RepID=UPI000DC14D3C|nr:F-box/SPRY domain-containing protein 1-like [Melanaphis sacchari]
MMDVCLEPQYLPDLVLDIIFSNLELPDFLSCMLVCQNWHRVIIDGRSEPWKLLCRRKVPKELLKSKLLSQLNNYKDKLRAFYHSWNPDDCSMNIVVKHNGFTLYRNQVPHSTDMARTKIGYSNGKHAWEITWTGPLGSVAMVGVSTKEAPVHCSGYLPLLGINEHSWGWNLIDNILLHNGVSHGSYPLLSNTPKYQIGEKLILILDSENGILYFKKCNEFLGIAFKNLPNTKLYPSVSTVYGKTEISIVYLGKRLCKNDYDIFW